MTNVIKKSKAKASEPTHEELMKRDAMALAQLTLDIYQDKKRKEKNNACD